jgi:hypothetical protein
MSLDYKLANIQNFETVCYETFTGTEEEMQARIDTPALFGPSWVWVDEEHTAVERLSPTTHCLIWASMVVRLGEITEANVEEWHRRLSTLESIHGAYRVRRDGDLNLPHPYTLDEVRAHIGLRVNVSDVPTRTWNAQIKKAALSVVSDNVLAQA